mmetsp:Transcript_79889/g.191853  ORF Transcript_79889/g.191853 Transcript_79889/m.191853 type:complete len:282 (-) Transcript_79889:182-1027(-)
MQQPLPAQEAQGVVGEGGRSRPRVVLPSHRVLPGQRRLPDDRRGDACAGVGHRLAGHLHEPRELRHLRSHDLGHIFKLGGGQPLGARMVLAWRLVALPKHLCRLQRPGIAPSVLKEGVRGRHVGLVPQALADPGARGVRVRGALAGVPQQLRRQARRLGLRRGRRCHHLLVRGVEARDAAAGLQDVRVLLPGRHRRRLRRCTNRSRRDRRRGRWGNRQRRGRALDLLGGIGAIELQLPDGAVQVPVPPLQQHCDVEGAPTSCCEFERLLLTHQDGVLEAGV